MMNILVLGSRKVAIAQEQAAMTTLGTADLAAAIAQQQTIKLDQERVARSLKLNDQERKDVERLFKDLVISRDEYNDRISQLNADKFQLEEEAANLTIQAINTQIEGFRRLADELRTINDLRGKVTDAQLKGAEMLIKADQVFNDALSQQSDLIRANADAAKSAGEEATRALEKQLGKLEKARSVIETIRGAISSDFFGADFGIRQALQNEVISALSGLGVQFDPSKLFGMDAMALNDLKKALKEAQKLGLSGSDISAGGLIAIQDAIEKKNEEIARQKQAALLAEQNAQQQLLKIEEKRAKLAAQTAIKEAEIAAIRAQGELAKAQIEQRAALTPQEMLAAQISADLAQQELNLALMQLDVSKQNAVIVDQVNQAKQQALSAQQSAELSGMEEVTPEPFKPIPLSELKTWKEQKAYRDARREGRAYEPPSDAMGEGIPLDPSVQAIADIAEQFKSSIDLTKYDDLLAQLDQAAQPLESQIEVQRKALNATTNLTDGITTLNANINRLVNTLGRPNVTVNGEGNVSQAIEIMRAANG